MRLLQILMAMNILELNIFVENVRKKFLVVKIIALIAALNWIGVRMSRYGESAPSYEKEDMYDNMKGFLAGHPLSELIEVLADVIETIEWEKAENE